MAKKSKSKSKTPSIDLSKDLWIAPAFSMRGKDGDRAWNSSGNLTPSAGARFLELADVALGQKKHATPTKKKKAATAGQQSDAGR